MLLFGLVLFAALVVYFSLKGELEYVRDNLEIQLRQVRFRVHRLQQRLEELEEKEGEATVTPASE